jgi:palmitoyl transferase
MSQINFKNFGSAICLSALLFCASGASFSQEVSSIAASENASWWHQIKSKTNTILDDGSFSMILSGYARHGRNTYTAERINELNEKAWGLGFSKAIRNVKDNEESLYGLAISDSHFSPQFMAGYAYQWMKPIGGRYEAGLGVTGLLISRADYFSGIPFPGVLPLASIGTRSSKLMAAYIPRVSRNKGNGDVLLLFVRFDLD